MYCILIVTEDPTVTSCRSTISSSGQSASVLCFNHSNLVFVNFVPTQINVTWEALYLDPNPVPRRPAYVRGFDIGLVGLYTEASLYRAASKCLAACGTAISVCIQILMWLFQLAATIVLTLLLAQMLLTMDR